MKIFIIVDGILVALTWALAVIIGQYFIAKDCGERGTFSYMAVSYECKPKFTVVNPQVVIKENKK